MNSIECYQILGVNIHKIEPEISVESIFSELESDRKNKMLKKDLTSSPIKYQISETHEGYLEQVNENGDVLIG